MSIFPRVSGLNWPGLAVSGCGCAPAAAWRSRSAGRTLARPAGAVDPRSHRYCSTACGRRSGLQPTYV